MRRELHFGLGVGALVCAAVSWALSPPRDASAAAFSGGIVVERIGGNADFGGAASAPAAGAATPIFLDEFSLTTGGRRAGAVGFGVIGLASCCTAGPASKRPPNDSGRMIYAADFLAWQQGAGSSLALDASAVSVPEPSSAMLAASGGLGAACSLIRKRRGERVAA